jgi:hypothetical protein
MVTPAKRPGIRSVFSPFEELEHLADYLPEEGESVRLTRRNGELVCEPCGAESLRDGIEDSRLYGQLVQANERLSGLALLPLWAGGILVFWTFVALFTVGGLRWESWFLVPGLGLVALWGCFQWIRWRQHRVFQREIWPALESELRRRGLHLHALIGGVRQHTELQTLLDELVRPRPKQPK